mmetsp:Transcript_26234/g.84412  ORF Transcript_26234/g.84412 Transcript_26234/m.84412 type:complete len:272 (-) Transcript_26234:1055-1870(-)
MSALLRPVLAPAPPPAAAAAAVDRDVGAERTPWASPPSTSRISTPPLPLPMPASTSDAGDADTGVSVATPGWPWALSRRAARPPTPAAPAAAPPPALATTPPNAPNPTPASQASASSTAGHCRSSHSRARTDITWAVVVRPLPIWQLTTTCATSDFRTALMTAPIIRSTSAGFGACSSVTGTRMYVRLNPRSIKLAYSSAGVTTDPSPTGSSRPTTSPDSFSSCISTWPSCDAAASASKSALSLCSIPSTRSLEIPVCSRFANGLYTLRST